MTQRRRVRALHLASCCTLHTYSIGCTASQRNNIVTIHHTSAVNKTSGSFCHPRSSSLAALTLSPSSSFSFLLSISPFPLIFALVSPPCLRLSADPFLLPTRTSTTYSPRPPIYLIFSFLPFFPSSSPRPVALFCASHFLSSRPANHPPTHPYIFSISLSAPFYVHPFSPLSIRVVPSFFLSLLHSCPVSTPASGKSIRVTSPVD